MRFLKPVAAAMALTIAALSFATSAEAKHRYRHHHRHHGGEAAVAAIFGFAAGAILSGALSQPRYRTYEYYEPAPIYVEPPVVYQPVPTYQQRPVPWTPEWYAYCDARYVSFNPANGLFLGFDGRYHFCR